jgi:catechol 2,3-dioxygenase-like lactoylglutathione lyase family enzyme
MIGSLSGIALECRDPKTLAAFYSAVTGWPVVYDSPDWVSIGVEGAAWHLSFQRSPGHQPPTWPDETSSMQFHLHFRAPDLDVAEAEVLGLGATRLGGDAGFHVYADPAGHPFCLVS